LAQSELKKGRENTGKNRDRLSHRAKESQHRKGREGNVTGCCIRGGERNSVESTLLVGRREGCKKLVVEHNSYVGRARRTRVMGRDRTTQLEKSEYMSKRSKRRAVEWAKNYPGRKEG